MILEQNIKDFVCKLKNMCFGIFERKIFIYIYN